MQATEEDYADRLVRGLEREHKIAARIAELRQPKWQADLKFYFSRIVIRALRIASGVAIGLGGLWVASIAVDELGKPFGALSPLELLGGLVAGAFALGLFWAALGAAFGEGESRQSWDRGQEHELRAQIEKAETEPTAKDVWS